MNLEDELRRQEQVIAELLGVVRSAAAIGLHTLPNDMTCKCSQCEMVREARAAIAKATGGQA